MASKSFVASYNEEGNGGCEGKTGIGPRALLQDEQITLDWGKYVDAIINEPSWMGDEAFPSGSYTGGIRSTGDGVSAFGWSQPFKLAAARSSLAITRS